MFFLDKPYESNTPAAFAICLRGMQTILSKMQCILKNNKMKRSFQELRVVGLKDLVCLENLPF